MSFRDPRSKNCASVSPFVDKQNAISFLIAFQLLPHSNRAKFSTRSPYAVSVLSSIELRRLVILAGAQSNSKPRHTTKLKSMDIDSEKQSKRPTQEYVSEVPNDTTTSFLGDASIAAEDDNVKLGRTLRGEGSPMNRFFRKLLAGGVLSNVEARGIERVLEQDRVQKVRHSRQPARASIVQFINIIANHRALWIPCGCGSLSMQWLRLHLLDYWQMVSLGSRSLKRSRRFSALLRLDVHALHSSLH